MVGKKISSDQARLESGKAERRAVNVQMGAKRAVLPVVSSQRWTSRDSLPGAASEHHQK